MAAHPGYAATNLQSHSGSRLTDFALGTLGNRLPTLYMATQDLPEIRVT
jgi:hypothetical protein